CGSIVGGLGRTGRTASLRASQPDIHDDGVVIGSFPRRAGENMGAQVRPRALCAWGGVALIALAVTGCIPASTEPEASQAEGHAPSTRAKDVFDLQAHRGGRGEYTES